MVLPIPKSTSLLSSILQKSKSFMMTMRPNAQQLQQQQPQQQQIRCMSKYLSKAAAKRRPLTTKRARKGYYKGNGCTKEGTFRGKAGRFVLDRSRMLELMVPDLTGFKLKPYIAKSVPKWAPEDRV